MKGHNFLMNRSLIKKIAAFSVSLALASGSLYYTPVTQVTTFSPVHAEQTVDELEQLKEENKKRIELLQSEIDSAKEKYDSIVTDEKLKSDYKCGQIVRVDKDGIICATLDGFIKIKELAVEGKKRCLAKDYLNGVNKIELIGKVLS